MKPGQDEREEIEDVLVALALCFLQDPLKFDTEINQKIQELQSKEDGFHEQVRRD